MAKAPVYTSKLVGIPKVGDVIVTVTLVTDKKIQKLNTKYFNRAFPTDVLSFNLNQKTGSKYYLGDIVVNRDQAKRQAAKYNNTFEQEVADLVQHGMLHLLGIHHKGDADTVHGIKV